MSAAPPRPVAAAPALIKAAPIFSSPGPAGSPFIMTFPLSELLFPSETVAVLTALAATLLLASKEFIVRRSVRLHGHAPPSSRLKLTEMSVSTARRPNAPRSSPSSG